MSMYLVIRAWQRAMGRRVKKYHQWRRETAPWVVSATLLGNRSALEFRFSCKGGVKSLRFFCMLNVPVCEVNFLSTLRLNLASYAHSL